VDQSSAELEQCISANCMDSAGPGHGVPEIDAAQPAAWKEFEFPGVLASVPEHRERVMELVSQHCTEEGEEIDVQVAVQEALANAALHGCNEDSAKRIYCTVACTPRDTMITVRDPGKGFDLRRADPENYRVTRLSHGRGLVVMRSLMSEVHFARNGAEIVMRKERARGT